MLGGVDRTGANRAVVGTSAVKLLDSSAVGTVNVKKIYQEKRRREEQICPLTQMIELIKCRWQSYKVERVSANHLQGDDNGKPHADDSGPEIGGDKL